MGPKILREDIRFREIGTVRAKISRVLSISNPYRYKTKEPPSPNVE
jgi:hypothetical protein